MLLDGGDLRWLRTGVRTSRPGDLGRWLQGLEPSFEPGQLAAASLPGWVFRLSEGASEGQASRDVQGSGTFDSMARWGYTKGMGTGWVTPSEMTGRSVSTACGVLVLEPPPESFLDALSGSGRREEDREDVRWVT